MKSDYFIYLSAAMCICFILYRFAYIRKAPVLTDVIQIFLASIACSSSADLIMLIFNEQVDLGDLVKYKESILLGSSAVIWVSVQTIYSIVYQSLSLKVTKKNPVASISKASAS